MFLRFEYDWASKAEGLGFQISRKEQIVNATDEHFVGTAASSVIPLVSTTTLALWLQQQKQQKKQHLQQQLQQQLHPAAAYLSECENDF